MKLIDKDTLVAEIKRRKQTWQHQDQQYVNGGKDVCDYLLGFLDTHEVKEIGVDFGDPEGDIGVKWVQEEPVSNDLEEAADKHLVEKGYLLTTKNGEHLAEVEAKGLFKAGAKWQKTKAYEWLKEHKEHPLIGCEDPCLSGYLTDEFIEDFKKAMEE